MKAVIVEHDLRQRAALAVMNKAVSASIKVFQQIGIYHLGSSSLLALRALAVPLTGLMDIADQ